MYNFIYFCLLVLSGCVWALLWLWQARAALQCSARASHCSGPSCCRAAALGCVGSADEAPRPYGTVVGQGWVALQHMGIVPDQESNPCLPHCQVDSLSLSRQGSPLKPSCLRVYGASSVTSVVLNSWRVCELQPTRLFSPCGFSRQEYGSGLPCPSPEDLVNPGIKVKSPASPALQADSSPLHHQGSPLSHRF